MSTEENKKQRRANFNTEETAALKEIIEKRKDFNNGKYIGDQKDFEDTWTEITLLLNNRKLGPNSTPQQIRDKWKRMMNDKFKDVENKAATGGDLTSESASAERDDKVEGRENSSSSEIRQEGMSVVKESPGPGTNTDILATSQAPGQRTPNLPVTRSDGCSSQNRRDQELDRMIEELSREKKELEIEKLRREIRDMKVENKESKNGDE